jgi:hypothetical protein
MGMILDTGDELLCLERRRESYGILDRRRSSGKSEHIFAYEDGAIEMSNQFLLKLIRYFSSNPEELNKLESSEARRKTTK